MSPDVRERILDATARLLVESGSDALSTRAVAAAANVQAPTLYRIFGDKRGLIEAVTAYGFERYLEGKQAAGASEDPIEDLRHGWDVHVEFALTHPTFYALMYQNVRPGHTPAAATEAHEILLGILRRVAHAGRLRVPVEAAATMLHAAGLGVALTLIAQPEQQRDGELSARVREAVLDAIATGTHPVRDETASPLAARALALDAALPETPDRLTPAETALLRQWLRRLAGDDGRDRG
ncbi:TetR/AcrR family transcriptional regulator [Rugosimonospora africana]|uniref:TetR family transcriptional regulator n=1 Tax=Rugosimonospora africana TaxID=556532 RepID=A0A8J3QMW0_9ACTN|nr:TetR/AcrR family transcriptional regulator [Rugosimonospora africana]GIH13396.1 TetR family transcriptional regulator [Rugosimonospora africana]